MTYFNNISNFAELKKAYADLAKQNHPDIGGDVATMQAINAEYEKMKEQLKNAVEETQAVASIDDLQTALKAVLPFVGKDKKAVVKMENNKIFFTAFGTFKARYEISAVVEGAAKFTIRGDILKNIADKFAQISKEVKMLFKGEVLTLKSGKSSYSLPAKKTLQGQFHFEKFVEEKSPKIFWIYGEQFCDAICKVYPAAEKSKYIFDEMPKSIVFKTKGDYVNLFASDTFQIAKTSCELAKYDEESKIAIRADVLKVFAKVIGESKSKVKISFTNDSFEIRNDRYIIRGALSKGDFLKFEEILSQKAKVIAEVKKAEVLDALSRLESFTKENKDNNLTLKFSANAGIFFTSSNPNIGKVSHFQIAKVEESKNISVNAEFLKNAISLTNDCRITISLTEKNVLVINEIDNKNFAFGFAPLKTAEQEIQDMKDTLKNLKNCIKNAEVEVEAEKIKFELAETKLFELQKNYDEELFKTNKYIVELKDLLQNEKAKFKNVEKILNGESLKKAKIILEETKKKYSYLATVLLNLKKNSKKNRRVNFL